MSDKSGAIESVEAAFRELRSAAEGVPDDRMMDAWLDQWSAKDILAHVASWDESAAADLGRIGRGHTPLVAAFKESEVDEWNAFLMRPRRLFSLAQVRFESEVAHQQLAEVLDGLPDVMFAPGIISNFTGLIAGHYREHARNILAWRQREGIA